MAVHILVAVTGIFLHISFDTAIFTRRFSFSRACDMMLSLHDSQKVLMLALSTSIRRGIVVNSATKFNAAALCIQIGMVVLGKARFIATFTRIDRGNLLPCLLLPDPAYVVFATSEHVQKFIVSRHYPK